MDDVYPAGRYWCPRCFARTEFVIAVDEPGATLESDEPPIECYTCGYVHNKIVEEVDPKTGVPYDTPRSRPAIPKSVRDKARAELRREFMDATLRDGVRRETFTMRRSR